MANSGVKLGDYTTTPLYNIKAVVQVTQISPSTLRAWERRYNVCTPQRSQSGYRLYSDRDVALIKWLKSQVDAGMSISQAVSWYDRIVDETDDSEKVVLPQAEQVNKDLSTTRDRIVDIRATQSVRSLHALQGELLDALISFNETSAERIVNEAFSLYTLEEVGDNLITPVLVQIGDLWHDGKLSITREHYATGYLRQRLISMLRGVSAESIGPMIWVGCAPGELHEIGSILLSIYMKRAGFQVRYLGQNLPVEDLVEEVKQNHPDMVLFSATSIQTVKTLQSLTNALSQTGPSGVVIGYGGQIFVRQPELKQEITGIYMGSNAQEAVDIAKDLLR